ncbi:HD domain-containing protein [Sphaerisporangium fuscum]|uniref:HD domain-containing protein n=1 Tax=Sphaerisporangium fuscum TaxID=2835868 RepID=UPI001BDBFAC6|nr:HD domain-containing protein [Sphaerisporangium fuscum]
MDSAIGTLLDALPDTFDAGGSRLVERAYTVAAYWHRDQRRYSGDPYITHPVAVAVILARLGADHETLCAALLHDVLEDTGCSEAELAHEFGERITGILRALRDLDAPVDRPAGWEASADEAVLLLKLADRLHNQRTMEFLPPEKRRMKSRESLEVYAPLARRLGLDAVGRELEELARATLSAAVPVAVPLRPVGNGHGDGMTVFFRVLAAGAVILPAAARARWLEEWLGELHALPGRPARARFAARLLLGMPSMAATLRRRSPLTEPRRRPGILKPRSSSARRRRDLPVQSFRRAPLPPPDRRRRDLPVRAFRPDLLLRGLRWWIASNLRVWALLAPLVGWMAAEAAASNRGDAVAILITVPPVLGAGVEALRARLRPPEQ